MGEATTISCYWCSSPVELGVRVCRGCNADVVYAATRRERATAFKWGLLLGAVLALFSIGRLATSGTSSPGIIFGALFGIMLAGGVGLMALRSRLLRGKIRFFRRTNL